MSKNDTKSHICAYEKPLDCTYYRQLSDGKHIIVFKFNLTKSLTLLIKRFNLIKKHAGQRHLISTSFS